MRLNYNPGRIRYGPAKWDKRRDKRGDNEARIGQDKAGVETGMGRARQRIVTEWHEKFGPLLNSDAVPMRRERICNEVPGYLPRDAMVLADTGHSGMRMGGMFDLRAAS